MTRTARSETPSALLKDRSVPRNGRDKHLKKDGGGAHGWGSLKDEALLESAAIEDEEQEKLQDMDEPEVRTRPRRASTLGEVKVIVKPAA